MNNIFTEYKYDKILPQNINNYVNVMHFVAE